MMRSLVWLAACCALWLTGCATYKPTLTVAVPVLDLRAAPDTTPIAGTHDPLQETQLLYGESVRVLATRDRWTQVQAVEQPEFTHATRWQGYPGWVRAEALRNQDELNGPTVVVTEKWASLWQDAYLIEQLPWRAPLGARLAAINMGETLWKVDLLDGQTVWMRYQDAVSLDWLSRRPPAELRSRVLDAAGRLLGDPYFWGGRSPHAGQEAGPVTGVDCSGLVNLAYRSAGVQIPRDAHEQFLRATPVAHPEPADLIFLSAKDDPTRIVHVMLYAGEGLLLEAPATGGVVRRLAATERFGHPWDTLTPGTVIDGQTLRFGSYLTHARK